jgi:hypothetical protein
MARVVLVDLIASGLQFRDAVFAAPRMLRIVVSDRCVTVKTQRDRVVEVGPPGIEMGHLDPNTNGFPAQAAVTGTPQEDLDLVLLSKIGTPSSHRIALSRGVDDERFQSA